MFPYQKNLALKQYQKTISSYIFTSHFIYSDLKQLPRINRLRLNIETKKSRKVYGLYLFLLTGQTPYIRKFYPSWKNSNSQVFLKLKAATHRVQVCVRPRNKFVILYEILTQIILKQLTHEKRIWRFQDDKMLVFVPTASLTKSTIHLQAKNSYFPNVPLTLHFSFSNMTAFQKIFFMRMSKIISSHEIFKGLDLVRSDLI